MEFTNTIWSLLPAVTAIVLALITKEVYSSLFIGICAGGLLYASFNFTAAMEHIFVDGVIGQLSDSWNVGILVFLVVLGSMVMLMNRAGSCIWKMGSYPCKDQGRSPGSHNSFRNAYIYR